MSEEVAGVKWEEWENYGCDNGVIYQGDIFTVRLRDNNWWAHVGSKLVEDNYAPDHATAKRDAERWILEREGRLPAPAPATDGGWIACVDRLPDAGVEVEMICRGAVLPEIFDRLRLATTGPAIYWRPRPADPHAVAACLFDDRYRPTVEQARAAARHVAGCAECRERLKAGGGA